MRRKRCVFLLAVALCGVLGGCASFPDEPVESMPMSGAGRQPVADTTLLLGPGPDEEGLPGAEWSVYELMRRSGAEESVDDGTLTVYIPHEAMVFYEPDANTRSAETVPAGSYMQIEVGDGPLWFACGDGWLYGEELYPVADGEPWDISLTEAIVEDRLERLEEIFPEGMYWNHMGTEPEGEELSPFSVTDEPCEHSFYDEEYCNHYDGSMLDIFPYDYLTQCLGFACLVSDQLFGRDSMLYILPEGAPLRIGDHIRLWEYEHSLIVREVDEYGLRLAEVNADYEDCLISWERSFSWEEWEDLYGWDVEYVVTRYPFCREDGQWQSMEAIPAHEAAD